MVIIGDKKSKLAISLALEVDQKVVVTGKSRLLGNSVRYLISCYQLLFDLVLVSVLVCGWSCS